MKLTHWVLLFLFFLTSYFLKAQIPAFPGAEGFGAKCTAGRGGRVIYVTNLNCSGPGSLNAALQESGPRYVLFKVSGVIDCPAEIRNGNVYVAGQTSPGGIIVRGLLIDQYYEPQNNPSNTLVRNIRSRPYTSSFRPQSGSWEMDDALRIDGANSIVIDHCSFEAATDEAIQLSRVSNLSIQNCLLAETYGDHFEFGGMLINYSTAENPKDSISIHHNCWNRIGGRMPEISCERSFEKSSDMSCIRKPMHMEFSCNLLWDIPIAVQYNAGFDPALPENIDSAFVKLNLINNKAIGRSTYTSALFSHSLLDYPNTLYCSGNRLSNFSNYQDYELFYCCNDFNLPENHPNTDLGIATRVSSALNFPPISHSFLTTIEDYMVNNVGAMPHDPMDRRLMKALASNQIDTLPVNGTDFYQDAYQLNFTLGNPPAAPLDTDLDGMPDTWEQQKGLNPLVDESNATTLSAAELGIAGYTNLEVYLELLQRQLKSQPVGIIELELIKPTQIYPNPSTGLFTIQTKASPTQDFVLINFQGKILKTFKPIGKEEYTLDLSAYPDGLYLLLAEGKAIHLLISR